MDDIAQRVREYLNEYPEERERIDREVSQWPPMSKEVAELWKAAKLNYLRQQQEQSAQMK